jgi:hypothetical protein
MNSETSADNSLSNAEPASSGDKRIPDQIREIAVSVAIAIRTTAVFALAIGFGLFVAIKLAQGNPWIGAGAAIGFLLFIVLPVRLWWTVGRSQ